MISIIILVLHKSCRFYAFIFTLRDRIRTSLGTMWKMRQQRIYNTVRKNVITTEVLWAIMDKFNLMVK